MGRPCRALPGWYLYVGQRYPSLRGERATLMTDSCSNMRVHVRFVRSRSTVEGESGVRFNGWPPVMRLNEFERET